MPQPLPLRNKLCLSLVCLLLCACGMANANSHAVADPPLAVDQTPSVPAKQESPVMEAPLSAERLAAIDTIVEQEIAVGRLPGAVVLVGSKDRVVYRRAFGQRSVLSEAVHSQPQPMTEDTIFDLASLTKVVATTTAILQLVEKERLELDAPAARYWPAFGAHGKAAITIRQLLSHSSGLPAGIDTANLQKGGRVQVETARQRLAMAKPSQAAGLDVVYSDTNLAVLGEIVARVSGQALETYAREHIFEPLAMADSGYLPSRRLKHRIAPTSMPAGQVHDPLARSLGGVAGNAGVFSTADDLARFARAVLRGGAPILSAASVQAMLSPQSPPGQSPTGNPRGLGWRLDPVLASNRAALPPVGAASHFGYTGTALWLDPVRQVYVIVLSNRLHPKDSGDAGPLRAKILAAVCEAMGPLPAAAISQARPELAERVAPYVVPPVEQPVQTGIDVLAAQEFAPLKGKRLGLLSHRSSVDAHGRRTVDVLFRAPGLNLVTLFSPEHGLTSDHEGKVKDDTDLFTGLPVKSLYGDNRRPSAAMLAGLDALVVDLQDVGVRFYTYASSLAYLLEAAAPLHIPVFVLDRPNPIAANVVQGPMLDSQRRSFTGYWPLPVRHGMTIGELARLFAGEGNIPVDLTVIPMQHYRRDQYYDQTGLPWVPPSPNLVRLASATLYPGPGMIEGVAISVGRGTQTPFELLGAPWIDKHQFSDTLSAIDLAGVTFAPVDFTPSASAFAGKACQGVALQATDRNVLNSPALGIALAATLYRLYPERFALDHTLGSVGSNATLDAIRAGSPVMEIVKGWERPLEEFLPIREKYLLYQ